MKRNVWLILKRIWCFMHRQKKRKMKLWFIMFCFQLLRLVILSSSVCDDDFTHFRIIPGTRMINGFGLKDVLKTQCCLTCLTYANCTSVNYNNDTSTCEINTTKMRPTFHRLQQAPGWNVFEKVRLGWSYLRLFLFALILQCCCVCNSGYNIPIWIFLCK